MAAAEAVVRLGCRRVQLVLSLEILILSFLLMLYTVYGVRIRR